MPNAYSMANIALPVSQSTPNVRPFLSGNAAHTKGLTMPKKSDATDPDLPPIGYIYEHWLTTKQAAEVMGISLSSAHHLCQKGRIRAIKIGGDRRGEWRIDPDSARRHIRRKPSGDS